MYSDESQGKVTGIGTLRIGVSVPTTMRSSLVGAVLEVFPSFQWGSTLPRIREYVPLHGRGMCTVRALQADSFRGLAPVA